MQVIAPDFYAPFAGKSSAQNAERPGDGSFDALLREEESRYRAEPAPRRGDPDAARRAQDDFGRDQAPRTETRRDERTERDERPVDDRDVAPETKVSSADERPDTSEDAPPAVARNGDDVEEPAAAAAGEDAEAPTTPGDESQPAAGTAEGQPTNVLPEQAATAATVGSVAAASNTPAPTAADKAAAKTNSVAATGGNAGTTAAAAAPTTAQAASGAGAAQTATQTTAETAAAEMAKQANPATAANRTAPAAPPAAPTEGGSRPGGTTARTNRGSDQVTVNQSSSGLSSRPSAALGGGAATAAMTQQADGTAADAPEEILNTAGAAQQGTANKATAQQPVQPAKGPEGSAKAFQASLPAAADPLGGNAGQPASGTPVSGPGPLHSGGVQNSSFTEAMAATRHTPPSNPTEQIAVQVQRAQLAGQEKLSIKLHPAELGRIEVKLESNNDGTLRAVISAERADTLDLLQRDARGLERALQDAGVKTDSGSLNFNLRGQNQGQDQQAGGDGAPGRPGLDSDTLAADGGDPAAQQLQQPRSSHDGALDIRV
jgi:flagellar hook-length control protein FliK